MKGTYLTQTLVAHEVLLVHPHRQQISRTGPQNVSRAVLEYAKGWWRSDTNESLGLKAHTKVPNNHYIKELNLQNEHENT